MSLLVNVQESSPHRAFVACHMSATWAEATLERALYCHRSAAPANQMPSSPARLQW